MGLEDGNEATDADLIGDNPARQLHQSMSTAGGVRRQCMIRNAEGATHADMPCLSGFGKPPGLCRRPTRLGHAEMRSKLRGARRRPVLRQIVRRAANRQALQTELSDHQVTPAGKLADTHAKIDVLLDQIDEPVGEGNVEFELRIVGCQGDQAWPGLEDRDACMNARMALR